MSRTTGYTCTAVVNLVLNGNYKKLEYLLQNIWENILNFVKDYLEERGVIYKVNKK